MTVLLQNSVGEGTRAPCCPQLPALDTGKSTARQKSKPCRRHVPSFIQVPQHCQGAPALLRELHGDPGPEGAPLCCCPVLAQAGSRGEAPAGGWAAKPESKAHGLCGERISLCAVVCVGPQHRD